jgi:hypothetical protein
MHASESEAGPMVQMIFARRTRADALSERLSAGKTPATRSGLRGGKWQIPLQQD